MLFSSYFFKLGSLRLNLSEFGQIITYGNVHIDGSEDFLSLPHSPLPKG